MPVAGDVDVPPDVLPVVQIDPCGTMRSFSLVDGGGTPWPFEIEEQSFGVQRLVPDAPLAPGQVYSLVFSMFYDPDPGDLVWFTVGDGTALPPTPETPAFTAQFQHTCGDVTILDAFASLEFPDADPAQRGLLVLTSTVDGVEQPGAAPVAYAGQATETMSVRLDGGREICVTARLEDLVGDVAWETVELCGPEVTCLGGSDRDDGGCGCDGVGSPAGGIALALTLLGVRRSRDRGRSSAPR